MSARGTTSYLTHASNGSPFAADPARRPRQVAAGAAAAARDQWVTDRGVQAPPWVRRRIATTALARATAGYDEMVIVTVARDTSRYAAVFEARWHSLFEEEPEARTLETATLQAVDLAVQGLTHERIVAALRQAAEAGTPWVRDAYRDLLTRGRRVSNRRPTQGEVFQSAHVALAAEVAAMAAAVRQPWEDGS